MLCCPAEVTCRFCVGRGGFAGFSLGLFGRPCSAVVGGGNCERGQGGSFRVRTESSAWGKLGGAALTTEGAAACADGVSQFVTVKISCCFQSFLCCLQTWLYQRILQIGTPQLSGSCLQSEGVISKQDHPSKYLEVKQQTKSLVGLYHKCETTMCSWEDEACLGIFATPAFVNARALWVRMGLHLPISRRPVLILASALSCWFWGSQ